jgi:peptidoglycan/xylan/chitin deacetylase (PgdA/CDA1 family)
MKLTPQGAAQLAAQWLARLRRRTRTPHGLVLMYHRVADADADPWGLCVSPQNFRAQIQALVEIAEPVPLDRLTATLRSGRAGRPVVAVTFDDGYLDNLTAAKPILDEFEVPATVFVTTGATGREMPFWWDRLADALLGSGRPPVEGDLRASGLEFCWRDPRLAQPGRQGLQARRRLHKALWSALRDLAEEHRDRVLDALRDLTGADPRGNEGVRPMRVEELHRLVAGGRVQVGAHTVSHPYLPSWPRDEKARQIELSAEQCREYLGRRPQLFAYPFGGLDDESVAAVRAAGFSLACSLRKDLVWEGEEPLRLPRIPVGNLDGRSFRRWLSWYWLP